MEGLTLLLKGGSTLTISRPQSVDGFHEVNIVESTNMPTCFDITPNPEKARPSRYFYAKFRGFFGIDPFWEIGTNCLF